MTEAPAQPDYVHDPVERELARTLFRLGPFAQGVSMLTGLVLGLALSPVADTPWLLVWYLALVASSLYRMLLVHSYRRDGEDPTRLGPLLAQYRIGITLSGLIWGSAILLTAPTFPVEYVAMTTLVLAGMVAGAVTVLSALRRYFLFFAVPALLPAMVVLFISGRLSETMVGVLVAYFVIAMRKVEGDLHGVLRKNAALTQSNVSMAADLASANVDLQHEVEDRTGRMEVAEHRARAMRALYEASSVVATSLEERLQRVLELGCRYFSLPYGLISEVQGDRYIIRHVAAVGAAPRAEPGEQHRLGDVICAQTVLGDEAVAFGDAGSRALELATHPTGEKVYAHAYVGARISTGGQPYGSLCFYAVEGPDRRFEEIDREFVRLIAQWVSRELTEHQLRAELRGKAEELTLITNSVDAGIAYSDRDLILRYANQQYRSTIRGERDIVGKHIGEILGDERFEEIRPDVERCLAGESVRYRIEREIEGQGHVVRNVSLLPHKGEGGAVLGVFALVYDVTEYHELQQELDRKVREIQTITDSVEGGIGYVDRDLVFRFANRHYAVLLGQDEEDLTGRDLEEVMGAENLHKIRPHLDEVFAGRPVLYEASRDYRGNRTQHLQCRIEPDRRGEEVVGMFCFVTDITRFRETERALARQTDLAETTLESVGEAVIRVSADGMVEYVNPAAVELTGRPEHHALGRSLTEVLPLTLGDGRSLAPIVQRQVIGNATRLELDEDLWLKSERGGAWVRALAVPLLARSGGPGQGLVLLRDVTSERRVIQELAHRAAHDTLTGLYNRREFERHLNRALEEARAGSAPFGLIYMDLDGFKEVNDAVGHLAGDQLLASVAEAMSTVMRQEDVLARIGGDEFAVLTRNTSLTDARAIAEKLRVAVRQTSLRWDEEVYRVGVSIGIAPVGEKAGTTRDVLELADQACYAAKRAGKDRIELATGDGSVH